jgi:hypothetical protein
MALVPEHLVMSSVPVYQYTFTKVQQGKLVGVVSIGHGILEFHLDHEVCGADLLHNPPAHLGLHRFPSDGLGGRPHLRVPRVMLVVTGYTCTCLGTSHSRAALLTGPPVSMNG